MNSTLEGLSKLKGRSWAELRERGAQALAARAERRGFSSHSRLPSDSELFRLLDQSQFIQQPISGKELLTHFQIRTSPGFFTAFDEPDITRAELRKRFGAERDSLIEQCERIMNGQFRLLGFDNLDFGQPIDWHLEPISGKRSPLVHWSCINEIDTETAGDKKITWELNRHQYFATLGRAYWMTGDERYAQTFASHLTHWMDENPPKLGPNWVSSLEVAFRSISWLWALYFFKESNHLTPDIYTRTLTYLYVHARHLETYLSTYSSPNTHLTGEALGLYYLGTLLPEFRVATRWREKGRRILIDEFERHVLADGVYFERATYYQRYTTDFYTHFLILCERNGEPVSDVLKEKLELLLDHLMYIAKPDGTTPLIGDDDGGQLLKLDERAVNDFRAVHSTGAALFQREDYKYVAGEAAEATLWLLGSEGLRKFERLAASPPAAASLAFPAGGFYVMRDGWTSDANYLLFDCGPLGVLNCGHAHADALSFELVARGRTLLVDTGTYTYTGSRKMRDHFRSSAAHNTLTIDGESSSVPGGAFSWKHKADASIIEWKSEDRFDFLSGAHDGYMRLTTAPAQHTRSVLFLKNDYWVVRDLVETDGPHHYDLHLHFVANSHPRLETSNEAILSPTERSHGASGLQAFSFAPGGEWRMEDGWVSGCYGKRMHASVCTYSTDGIGAQEFFSFLIPLRAAEVPVNVDELEAAGGRAFSIRNDASRDILIVGNGAMMEAERIKTDFNWAWLRFAGDGKTLDEMVLMNGRSLWVDNHEILNAKERIDYAVGRRVGETLLVEIGDKILNIRTRDLKFQI